MLKKGDIILLAAIIVAVIAVGIFFKFFYGGGTDLVAVIKQDGKIIKTIDLHLVSQREEFKVSGKYEDIILIEKDRIRFEEADCPDKVCVRTGWLDHSGETAACLPNRTIIELRGENPQVDGVAY